MPGLLRSNAASLIKHLLCYWICHDAEARDKKLGRLIFMEL